MPTPRSWKQRLSVRKACVGKGVFARRPFRKRQTIAEVRGRIIHDLQYYSRHCIELSDVDVLEPYSPFRYLNHSCQPNCEIFSWKPDRYGNNSFRVYISALRAIKAGEELTIDYAWNAEAAIPCLCQSPRCRGWIISASELPHLRRRKALPSRRRRA